MNKLAIPGAVILAVILLLPVSCATPTPAPSSTPAPTPSPVPAPTPPPTTVPGPRQVLQKIHLEAVSNRSVYSLGEPVIFTVSIVNVSSAPMVLSPDPPTIEIVLPGKSPGQNEIVETLAPGSGQVKLESGGKVTYTLVWDQRDSHGKQVPPGYYYPNIQAIRDIKIDGKVGDGVGTAFGILIQPPPEPGERVLEINQSQTVKGITFTLERMELTSAGTKVYTSVKPAGPGVSIFVVRAEAEYSIGAGPLKKAGPSEILQHVLHIWEKLDPVPSDAKELTFTITQLGDWEGPWEFYVSLE